MKDKAQKIIIIFLAIIIILHSFYDNSVVDKLFTFESNIWVYRLFWTLVVILNLYGYFLKKEKISDKK